MSLPPIPFTTRMANIEAHIAALDTNTVNRLGLKSWLHMHRLIIAGHGTRSMHHKGCGCPWCKEAERRYDEANGNRAERKRRSRAKVAS